MLKWVQMVYKEKAYNERWKLYVQRDLLENNRYEYKYTKYSDSINSLFQDLSI